MAVGLKNSIRPSASGGIQFDHERLRLVTQNFRALQGLYKVAWGSFLATYAMVCFRTGKTASLFEFGLLIVLLVLCDVLIENYYRERFGTVAPSSTSTLRFDSRRMSAGSTVMTVLVAGAIVLSPAFGPNGISFMPFLFGLALLGHGFWLHPELTRLRTGYLVPIFLGAASVTLYPILSSSAEAHLAFWRTINVGLIGIGFVAVGLGDHILLVRLMPKRVTPDEGGGHDDK